MEPGDPHIRDVANIQRAGMSAAALTRQLLAFSRKEAIEPTPLELGALVRQLHPMLSRLIGERVAVVPALSPLPTARARAPVRAVFHH